jgi:surface polysaccharide O-acyltransferase-like enzyme
VSRLNQPANQTPQSNKVDLPVDLIRFVGVVLVILLHASIESYSSMMLTQPEANMYWWASTIYNSIARVAVPLFVILSGALLLQPNKVKEPIRVFLKKRLLRIGLAFVFWSIVYFAWRAFVLGQTLTLQVIVKDLVGGGAYYHFWFLYLIAGLYLATPILRYITAYADRRILRYLLVLWIAAVAVMPLILLVTDLGVNGYFFIFAGWVGYYIMGIYLQKIHVRRALLYALLAVGYTATIVAAWIMAFPAHYKEQYYFFFDSLTLNVIAASVGLYLLLCRFPANWPGEKRRVFGRFVRAVTRNTLPIYLLQLIVMETLQRGYLGFTLSLTVLNPIIEIPLQVVATLLITLGLVLAMDRVPILNKLIGRSSTENL